MYLDGAEANEGSVRSMEAMRAAVTFDIFGVVFWFVAFVVGCVGHCLCRRTKGQDHQFDETANMETGLVRLEDGGAESSDEKGNLDGRAMHGDEKSGK